MRRILSDNGCRVFSVVVVVHLPFSVFFFFFFFFPACRRIVYIALLAFYYGGLDIDWPL
jgi:hypothetical protein